MYDTTINQSKLVTPLFAICSSLMQSYISAGWVLLCANVPNTALVLPVACTVSPPSVTRLLRQIFAHGLNPRCDLCDEILKSQLMWCGLQSWTQFSSEDLTRLIGNICDLFWILIAHRMCRTYWHKSRAKQPEGGVSDWNGARDVFFRHVNYMCWQDGTCVHNVCHLNGSYACAWCAPHVCAHSRFICR